MLLVEQEYPAAEQYVRQDDGNWLLKAAEALTSAVELPSIVCRLTFAEIYARIDFPPDARRPLRPIAEG